MADQPQQIAPYPWAELVDAMGVTDSAACIALGISGSTLRRYLERGLTLDQADRLAVRAGLLPYEVWPRMVDDLIAAHEEECAAPDCPVRFVPPPTGRGQKRRRYCSRTCQQRTNNRRRYQTDEATRRRRIEASRRYKREIAEIRRRRNARLERAS